MEEGRIKLLAERHRKVLRLYGQRYRLKEIARQLSLSEHSVNTYLTEAVQILEVGGRSAAAAALARAEDPSQESRYQPSAPDSRQEISQEPDQQRTDVEAASPRHALPLRPKSGQPNTLSAYRRLLWMLVMLITLVVGIAIAVAVYTVYVDPMEHLVR